MGALNRDFARVVSCNTTALSRVMYALHQRGWVKRVRAVLLRRGTDPWESHVNGMINTVVPETKVPSHQGPDVQSVIPDLDITTLAAAGPFNLSHIHFAMVETTRAISIDECGRYSGRRRGLRWSARRTDSLDSIRRIELMRDLRRPRADLWEVAVWENALAFDGRDLCLTYQVDNEAIVIPETIDCIRAMAGLESDGANSIAKTDRALGITQTFLPATSRE